jgi:hypothetical protein
MIRRFGDTSTRTSGLPSRSQSGRSARSTHGRLLGAREYSNPTGKFDAAGRLLAGRTITLDLTDYVFAPGAVFGNITVTSPLGNGYLVVYPSDPRPPTSSINFVQSQTIANFSLTGMSPFITISIFASATTHVIFDVTAFAVGHSDFVNPSILPAAMPAAAPAALSAEPPEWFKSKQSRRAAAR